MGHCHANDRKAKASKKSGGSGKFDQKELRNDLIHEINEVRYIYQKFWFTADLLDVRNQIFHVRIACNWFQGCEILWRSEGAQGG